jgi:transcriptional antiterminator RfaH
MMQWRDESGTIVFTPRRFAVGDAVKVTTGPFADLEGMFQAASGSDRVVLLFNLLGREVRASVPFRDLVA